MPGQPTIRRVAVDEFTVADAVNLYLDHQYARAQAGQVGWAYYRSCHRMLASVADVLGMKTPLAEVSGDALSAMVLHYAQRPLCKKRCFQKMAPGQRISAVTAKGFVTAARTMFTWVSEHDLLTWPKPRGFGRIFRLKRDRIRTQEELRRAEAEVVTGDVRTFPPDELTRLFRAARSRERLYIILALNCGFTSGEISSLHTFEVFLDAAVPYIHRRRPKTGIEAKWCLWPETVALLKRHRARDNPSKLWLLTPARNSLVEVNEQCRRDAVDQAWKALRVTAGLPRTLSFRFLRKTGANAIKRLGGLEESEMYLAHQELGLNKHYANRNWDRMWTCLEAYRKTLPFLGLAWDLDPEECLFTQTGNPEWRDVHPPRTQRATKRSQTRLLNVSLHPDKNMYYARVYDRGRTYSRGYFPKPLDAANAAREIRLLLERGLNPRTHLPKVLPGQRGPRASKRP